MLQVNPFQRKDVIKAIGLAEEQLNEVKRDGEKDWSDEVG
jgi:hypothetical protein